MKIITGVKCGGNPYPLGPIRLHRNRAYLGLWFGILFLTFSGFNALTALGQPENSAPPLLPPNPLEVLIPDPLVPNPPKKNQSLTPEELRELELALNILDAEASAELAAGNKPEAFTIWYRELRLWRYFGPLPEVRALTRVGATAWEQSEITALQAIDARLKVIYQKYCLSPQVCELPLLQALVTGFETVRSRDLALTVYQQLLTDARDRNDAAAEESILTNMGRLYLEKLDYVNASTPYQGLLSFAVQRRDRPQELSYLEQLAFIYTQANDSPGAIATRERLVTLYNNPQDIAKIPQLKLAIATDYERLGQLQTAISSYEQAYTFAWTQQQFYIASDALEHLARLYTTLEQFGAALEVYEALLIVERRAYNLYGIMHTYDRLGQLHQRQNAYPQAIQAFQNGLEVARQLKYQEAYFTEQIDRLVRRSRPLF
ncbi:tetratricopeptide repeat protein [Laspinema olomoucense]|uniref:tetratricopeptide repeat protein n=1 Tax=Laspinema olomoucense TaxID=3231600 RepID=UPI0021BBA7DA|nr:MULTISPECIES: tetratricopeptide repeat protein [unclassified Laspinema]MCT7974656.1 tetratricopeptide repeat protein [Laspinema sp. D3d]MCT7989242.1 tetratricopeptide repeat protein [Laspinema sp. D3a]